MTRSSRPFYPEVCELSDLRELDDSFRTVPTVEVPVLFVSGTHDVRTPPQNVFDLESGFSRARHVIVTHAGHGSRELMSEEYRDLMQSFFRGDRDPDATYAGLREVRIKLPPIHFERVDEE